jgi:PAS domain S-box-containing protein
VNYQFEKQLGYKGKQISSLISIIHPDDVQNVMAVLSESRKGFKNLEFRVQNSKKKWIYFSVNAVPIKDGMKVAGFSGTMRNIDEKKKAEDKTELRRKELEKQNKELVDREKIKSTFVSNVSHDLRTPLTSIQGYSELLSNKVLGELNKEQTEAASVIHGEALRLGKLINDILDVSRIDAGVLVLRKKSFLLSAIEDRCSCRPIADSKGLTIIWNTPDSIGEVYADPDRISQVITNLVSNAIKFTDRGSVTVNAFKRDRNFIQIDVIDTGIGISDKEVKNRSMFERFHRLENKGNKREGTGLGLAIVEDIVKLHGGEIHVESRLGKGSKFFFTIPRYSSIKNKLGDLNEQSEGGEEQRLGSLSESVQPEQIKQENSLAEPKI